MASKLAGQRAKFSRARASYYTSADDEQRRRAVRLMAEVLVDAPSSGFSEDDVTQGEDVPTDARLLIPTLERGSAPTPEDNDSLVRELLSAVDTSSATTIGQGDQFVYAYGYRCIPDRLKIGSCMTDVVSRVAAQIGTSTPDRLALMLTIRTHDCRALERVLHGVLRLDGRQVAGAGAERFVATLDEVVAIHARVIGDRTWAMSTSQPD